MSSDVALGSRDLFGSWALRAIEPRTYCNEQVEPESAVVFANPGGYGDYLIDHSLVSISGFIIWGSKILFYQPVNYFADYAALCLSLEKRNPQARELIVIAVLCAIAVAGRTAFSCSPV